MPQKVAKTKQKNHSKPKFQVVFVGAVSQIRTGDLILTKDALYRLSYNSMVQSLIIVPDISAFVKTDLQFFPPVSQSASAGFAGAIAVCHTGISILQFSKKGRIIILGKTRVIF